MPTTYGINRCHCEQPAAYLVTARPQRPARGEQSGQPDIERFPSRYACCAEHLAHAFDAVHDANPTAEIIVRPEQVTT